MYPELLIRRTGWALVVLALASCGPTIPPGSSARAPQPAPAYVVAIPVPTVQPRSPDRAPRALAQQVDALVRGFQGRAGVAIRAVDDGWTIESGGRQRLSQQSVSKLWVAMTVLDQRDQGRLRLDDAIVIRREDLTLFHQPIASLVKDDGYQTTVGNLLFRALTHSDNTANDRLLTLVGGPGAVRAMIERKQLGDIRFGPGERLLQSGTAGLTWNQSTMALGNGFEIARSRLSPDVRQAAMQRYVDNPPDGAAPLAIADALARLARGELLSETSTRLFLSTMGQSVTGRARLRAALPTTWQIAHKTGTGQELGRRNAGFNDVGLAHRARRQALCRRGDDRRYDAADARAPAIDPVGRRRAHRLSRRPIDVRRQRRRRYRQLNRLARPLSERRGLAIWTRHARHGIAAFAG